jgi:hypothetical protein
MAAGGAKAAAAAGGLRIDAGPGRGMSLSVEPLFKSIGTGAGLGMRAARASQWHLLRATDDDEEVNAWEICHRLVGHGGMGVAARAEFAEPDLEQRWVYGSEPQHAMAMVKSCEHEEGPDGNLPFVAGHPFWFRDAQHSQLEAARTAIGQPSAGRVRIAHFDTGYDPEHATLPKFLLKNLQKNFVDDKHPDDATDRTQGLFNNLGHGTGTLSLLAGAGANGAAALGGAAFLDVIPVRVADSVVLFKNSSIARAFDYVHGLLDQKISVHVITMSMGGLASRAWAEAVNALYEAGVFIVTAAGNNFGNLPTHNIVYPARFKRVIAACGVMENGRPYTDLPIKVLAGNYGPQSKMETALAAYTPNTPWARLGCSRIVDQNGRGTSAATPQVASAAALWIQKHKKQLDQYSEKWMRVEAVRRALFDSARLAEAAQRERLGRGILQAEAALSIGPAKETELRKQPADSVSFPFIRVLGGFGIAAQQGTPQAMLELEALQLSQRSQELERLLPDPEVDPQTIPLARQKEFLEALAQTPGASKTLREAVGKHLVADTPQVTVPDLNGAGQSPAQTQAQLHRALYPPAQMPVKRRLRVFAFDPLLSTKLETVGLNRATLDVRWEDDLKPGPVGEYLSVVDIDPATGACYAPVDLNGAYPLSQAGLSPSETNPQFHQQMVYAVAMKTIEHFEYALGRVALWAPRPVIKGKRYREYFVRRLRIYPHAVREANSFYSPDKKALLFGYFPASESDPGGNLPGQTIFCCLSHDIVAHETTHALLDGLQRRLREPTNQDMLAFHEAFADLVSLFQHFTVPEALSSQIARTRGDLSQQNLLGELAQQFGEGTGRYGALRSAIGQVDRQTHRWEPIQPTTDDYENATEPHDRGAILVAAVFDAFLNIYRTRSEDLIRLATGGSGVLQEGAIAPDLVSRLAEEASKAATHVLNMCIRALDYCPPVDLTYGDYIRALITADRDLVPDDPHDYRVAFMQAFRRRGIYPKSVRSLSTESFCWNSAELKLDIRQILRELTLGWDLRAVRRRAYYYSITNARLFHHWLKEHARNLDSEALGFYVSPKDGPPLPGNLHPFEVHSVRPLRRMGPDNQQKLDLIVEITQSWRSATDGGLYRGGTTLIIDMDAECIRYCINKRVAHAESMEKQRSFQLALADASLRSNYFDDVRSGREPFAMLHRGA